MIAYRLLAAVDPFEVVFDHFFSHFGQYLDGGLTNVDFQMLQHLKIIRANTAFDVVPQKKSNYINYHDLGGQLMSPKRKITLSGNFSCNKAKIDWDGIKKTVAGKKKIVYHTAIAL